MPKYINADELKEKLKKDDFDLSYHWSYVQMLIDEMSTADVAEVVRCKDCKHSKYREDYDDYECEASGCGLVNNADFYCADGKRRDTE